MKIEEISNKKDYSFNAIYLWTNLVNGKKYVGQAQNFYERMRDYISGQESDRLIGRALLKYGFDNFDISILEKDIDYSHIDEREQYWMDYYQSYDLSIGYNICRVASSTKGYHHTEEDKKRMSEIAKKRFHDHPEYIRCGELNPMYGKHHTQETKDKMGHSRMGNQNAKGCTWTMRQETKNKISEAMKGKQNSLGSKRSQEFKDKVAESNRNRVVKDSTRKKISESNKGKTVKKVLCVETNVIYNSIGEAGEAVKIDRSAIGKCCKGRQKTAAGFHWQYADK